MRQTEEREHKLLGDIKRASFGIEKNMIQNCGLVRGKIPLLVCLGWRQKHCA